MKFAQKLDSSFLTPYRAAVPPWGPVGYVTYKRTYSRRKDEGKTESWFDSLLRCVEGVAKYGAFTKDDLETLFHYWFFLKCTGGGRHLWQLGTSAVERIGADSLQNCWFVTASSIRSYVFAMDQLMLGGGVGIGVKAEHVYKLPPVRFNPDVKRSESFDCDFIVPDNREGWCLLLEKVLEAFFIHGRRLHYSTKCLREKGQLIKTFGGVASGGEILVEGISLICKVLRGAFGRQLTDVEAMDIFNIIGMIVVAGNIRRSSELIIGDSNSTRYLEAKKWQKGNVPIWRSNSNNSVDCWNFAELPEAFWDNYNGEGEPVGLVNIRNARRFGRIADGEGYRPDRRIEGFNPCVVGETRVLTPVGEVRVEDVLGTRLCVKDGNGNWSWTTDKGFFYSGLKQVMTVETDSRAIRVTPNHRLMLENGEWVEAQNLRVANRLRFWNGNEFVAEKLVRLEEHGATSVYDCQVPGANSYVSEGFVSHNCAEIGLEPFEACNLSDIYLPNVSDAEFYTAAEVLLKVNKTISAIPHAQPETREVVERNHRVGIGVTGFLQAPEKHDPRLFTKVYRHIEEVDREYSKLLGIQPSIKLTTVKPSGTLSLLAGVAPGMHPAFGQYYIRRITFAADDELVGKLRSNGYHVEPKLNLDGSFDLRSMVAEFPCATPIGTDLQSEVSAVRQLDHLKFLQTFWADNSVSCTVHYHEWELPAIRDWLSKNYDDNVKSVSFLLRGSASGFKQLPYEEITEEEFKEYSARVTPIVDGIDSDGTMSNDECAGGSCPVR